MAVMDAVDTEASLTKFKSLVREKEKKAKRRSISVRWGRYASAAAAFLAGLVFAGGIAWGSLSNKLSADSLGHKYHGDHAYVFYQKPVDARKYPLVFAHGVGQFSKTWETTPDGREGFQNIFLRKGFSTYLVDQPRRGNAGRSTEGIIWQQYSMKKNG